MSNKLETLSFEFFPPRTEKGVSNLHAARETLETLKPEFFSVTYGAGGTSQDQTLETVLQIQENSSAEAVPHLTCVGSTKEKICGLLDTYISNDIKRIVALRGDLPEGVDDPGEFKHASDLVRSSRESYGDHFHIEVACYPEVHPQSESLVTEIQHFKTKADAGANRAISQYFFSADAFFKFRDECLKKQVEIPLMPGIMPITNAHGMIKFSDGCGAHIPEKIRTTLIKYADDKESLLAYGLDTITSLSEKLLENDVDSLHFYCMNRAEPSMQICHNLGLA